MRMLVMMCVLAAAISSTVEQAVAQNAGPRPTPEQAAAYSHMVPTDPRSTVRHVLLHQVRYRAMHGRYAASADSLGVQVPEGVSVRIVLEAGGFSVVASQGEKECGAVVRPATAPRPYVRREAAVDCKSER
jgi:hypothetical protein